MVDFFFERMHSKSKTEKIGVKSITFGDMNTKLS